MVLMGLALCACGSVTSDNDAGSNTSIDGSSAAADSMPGAPDAMWECDSASECDDNQFCNGQEQCVNHQCVAGTAPTLDDGVGCTVDTCNETTDEVENTPDDGACADTLFCNGTETCDPVNDCQPGTAVTCQQDTTCTAFACSESQMGCESSARTVQMSWAIPFLSQPGGNISATCGNDTTVHAWVSGNCSNTAVCELDTDGSLTARIYSTRIDPQGTFCLSILPGKVYSGCAYNNSNDPNNTFRCCFE